MEGSGRLFTKEFVALNCIAFLSNANMAVFFQFHQYLSVLAIGEEWFGTIIGLFSIAALVVRPLVSPFLHDGNLRFWMMTGTAGLVLSLWGYSWALHLWSMVLVRIMHGITYVVVGTAFTAILVRFIPPSRSGQAFGLMTVIMLLPFAIVPPLLDCLTAQFGGFVGVVHGTAFFMVLIFPLTLMVTRPAAGIERRAHHFIGLREFMEDLRNYRVSLLLLLMLLLYTGYAPVFFFLERYATGRGIESAGLFFTISITTEIAVRVVAGSLFDKINKILLAVLSFLAIGIGYVVLSGLSGPGMLYGLAVFLGLGWGVVMPVLNALMFDVSSPRLKGFNANLGMQMFQAGFFVGPLIGGAILTHGGFRGLYYFCAACSFLAMALSPAMGRKRKPSDLLQ